MRKYLCSGVVLFNVVTLQGCDDDDEPDMVPVIKTKPDQPPVMVPVINTKPDQPPVVHRNVKKPADINPYLKLKPEETSKVNRLVEALAKNQNIVDKADEEWATDDAFNLAELEKVDMDVAALTADEMRQQRAEIKERLQKDAISKVVPQTLWGRITAKFNQVNEKSEFYRTWFVMIVIMAPLALASLAQVVPQLMPVYDFVMTWFNGTLAGIGSLLHALTALIVGYYPMADTSIARFYFTPTRGNELSNEASLFSKDPNHRSLKSSALGQICRVLEGSGFDKDDSDCLPAMQGHGTAMNVPSRPVYKLVDFATDKAADALNIIVEDQGLNSIAQGTIFWLDLMVQVAVMNHMSFILAGFFTKMEQNTPSIWNDIVGYYCVSYLKFLVQQAFADVMVQILVMLSSYAASGGTNGTEFNVGMFTKYLVITDYIGLFWGNLSMARTSGKVKATDVQKELQPTSSGVESYKAKMNQYFAPAAAFFIFGAYESTNFRERSNMFIRSLFCLATLFVNLSNLEIPFLLMFGVLITMIYFLFDSAVSMFASIIFVTSLVFSFLDKHVKIENIQK